jgi:CDP-glucose 4,6-dehydratase
MKLAKMMWEKPTEYCESWNFGPNNSSITSVWDVANLVVSEYGKGKLVNAMDLNSHHEAKLLLLDISKARFRLEWSPKMDLAKTIKLTVDWYKKYKTNNMYDLCVSQIESFIY